MPAVGEFGQMLSCLPFDAPTMKLVCNRSAAAVRGESPLKAMQSQQLDDTARWARRMQTIARQRPHCTLEVGLRSSLFSTWDARGPDVPPRLIDPFRSPAGIAD